MTPFHWQIIAREVAKEIKKKVDGIVLMHGTDTLHYTSAALSFMLQDLPVPVVLVGAQRSSDRGSSDNAMNLLSSVLTAAKSDIAEVTVCMHGSMSDDFCFVNPGTKVRKLHSSRRDAFQTVNALPYAKVWWLEKKIEYLREDFVKRGKRTVKLDDKINPNVGIVYIHPGIKPEFIENLANFYEGIVIAGTGLGHVPTNPFNDKFTRSLIPSLKKLIDSGIPVVIAPQTIFGRLDMNVYTAGRLLNEIGVIGNYCDWLPETAFVKLMWVLGHTKEMNKIKELMLKNIAGEISERI
jgi:glutamyl-tRNA(Gln) amidotransferase subunit D